MDLHRVAIGLQRGSTAMANRFKAEALQRAMELERHAVSPYVRKRNYSQDRAQLLFLPLLRGGAQPFGRAGRRGQSTRHGAMTDPLPPP